MQRPDDLDVCLFDVPKQHGQIDIAVMEIVQMNDIGLEFVELSQKIPGRDNRKTPVIARPIR